MKIEANRKSLLAALSLAALVACKRQRLPVLENVLIDAKSGGGCTLTATDENVVVRVGFDAEIKAPGATLAPCGLLRSMASSMTDDVLTLVVEKTAMRVLGSGTKHTAATEKPNDFTPLPNPEWNCTAEVAMPHLAACLKAVVTQTDETNSRFSFASVQFDLSENCLSLVATDGAAIGVASFAVEYDGQSKALVPAGAAKLIASIRAGGLAKIKVSANWLSLEFAGGEITVRLAEGLFPQWRHVMPSPTNFRASVVPSQLTSYIKRTCVAPPDAEKGPQVRIKATDGAMEFTHSVGGTESVSSMPCETEGAMTATLNWRYLLEAMSGFLVFDDEPVQLANDGEASALLLSRDGLSYAIMPIRKD